MLLLAGCALPNLKPFADATAALHGALVETDSNVRRAFVDVGQPSQGEALAAQLALRIEAMKAVVNYSDSPALIAEAGNTGSDNAGKVAGALDGLLGALSAPALPLNYVALAKSLYGAVASVRAARSFADAVERADPAIQGMAAILVSDLGDIEKVLQTAGTPIQQMLEKETDNQQVIDYRRQLERKRRQLEKALATDTLDPGKVSEIRQVNGLIELTRDRYDPLMAKIEALKRRNADQVALAAKAREGIRQWAAIHAALAASVNQGMAPNTRLLTATAIEIREIISRSARS